jgi:glycosyltransferase involved in cell wall biosynthesis
VLSQRRRADEIVVVDDGSTDETAKVVARYAGAVTLVRKPQGGASSARNVGVASSKADFVAFLDSDDFWDRDHLERMQGAIDATGGRAWLSFSDMRLQEHYGGGTLWSQSGFAISGAHELRDSDKQWLFLPRQPILIQASVVRRDAYLRVGGSDTHLVRRGDTHLIFKLGLGGPICAVAGLVGERTADDPKALTRLYPSEHPTYLHCTTWLYRDLLRRPVDLTPEQRRILSRRLAEGHFEVARRSGLRRPLTTLAQLYLLFKHNPGVFFRRVGMHIRKRTAKW